MPSLAIFLHQLVATGVARNAVAIAQHMREAGWRVTLVTVRQGGELAHLADGLDHVVLGGAKLPRKLELLRAVPALGRELTALAPDIVMSAGNHAHLAMVYAAHGLRPTPRIVYRISNDLLHNARNGDPIATLSPRRLIANLVVREASRLVLVSPHLASDAILTTALAEGRAQVIANGVDIAAVRARAAEPCDHPWTHEAVPIVLGIGRLARQKNFGTLVTAFAHARAERPLRLMIVGGGKRASRERLEQQARELGVLEDVAFVGRVTNPFPYMRAASVLALPSVWEGASNVLLEALACDVPIVASYSAGNAEQVLDGGRFGLLVDPWDAQAMAQALLAQVDSVRAIRPGARAADYDRSRTLAEYQAMFEDLIRS
ncbi:glycosyltransferase involved in cell wall biosynthesis [Novosphingobium chloroacetimidivorans]|uniref:Glycosyltransferase involved in cell wall biosynthesis n=1 Tax=Novosphingobium chloroacetimidivorans TaxID=1428314 RepID=A0A7W7K7Z7_9SPHN|nr:glycosyltransferase [Novosphingobium chloroacetimidivorans]MBB4857920.1 glycosyltransferase involved in cell wall biosynthesis [Novosphingobium chloroacetimidivorans]